MSARLKVTYEKEIITKLMSKLSLKNKHDVPKIKKIILNMGLGEDASDGHLWAPSMGEGRAWRASGALFRVALDL